MPILRLDRQLFGSALWHDIPARQVFITALIMSAGRKLESPTPTMKIRSFDDAGLTVPPGFYGFVNAGSPGILGVAGISQGDFSPIERLCSPSDDVISRAFNGQMMARIDGGFLILDYAPFVLRDPTGAARAHRYRERHAIAKTA